jgi:DNA polymerase I-like protein with 3'-5' exonuclease and polymerase domains
VKAIPYTEEAYRLFLRGAQALARVEANGIRVDVIYIDSTLKSIDKQIQESRERISSSNVVKTWRKVYRDRANLDSNEQLGKVIFDHLKWTKPEKTTEGGRYKTDEVTLAGYDDPFIKDYMEIKKLIKSTQFLKGISRETKGGFLHPSFNLHTTVSFRSSSDSPNFQNLPVRNEQMMRAVRQAFIPRKGRRIVEVDYGGIEVKVAACYNKDPNLIRYIKDPASDMHRDTAQDCFLITPEEWAQIPKEEAKKIRYVAKNKMVFPQFYGDYWLSCAANLWDDMQKMHLHIREGLPMKKWLRQHGIKRLGDQDKEGNKPTPGTFEAHIAKVQESFWGVRFKVYDQWRKDLVEEYRRIGWMKSLTGFIYQGALRRNQIFNLPVQGSAFHCLLWSLNEIVLTQLHKRRMKTLVVGQIHDSIVADVPEEETDEYLSLVKEITVDRLMEQWDWIICPLEVEAEAAPVGGTWADKKGIAIPK